MHRQSSTQKHSLQVLPLPPGAVVLVGGVGCALAALAVSGLAAGHTWQIWVPLYFSIVLFLTAMIFGTQAGLLGSVLAALVFAIFLFSPVGKLNVANDTARTNLGWMTLTGIAFSFLFAPQRPTSHHR